MEQKTKVHAEPGKQEVRVTREFDLPVELLFKAYVEPALLEQWMGTTVLKFENKKHGGWQFQNRDAEGKVVFQASGAFHEIIPDKKITRTFEMDQTPYGVQLEIYDFEPLTESTSKLTMHVIYETVEQRDGIMKLGYQKGLNYALQRLEDTLKKVK